MSIGIASVLLFGVMLLVLATGLPLAFSLSSVAMVFTLFLWGPKALYVIVARTWNLMNLLIVVAVPLFIFMANMLEKSGVADDLYEMMYRWMGRIRGGLAMGTVLICTLMAAMTGISGAATVTMGLIALPSMLKRNYDKHMAIGCIQAGGALGILIPPSIIMIFYAVFAQQSVGKLFAGGVFPGLILSSLFIAYIAVKSNLQRDIAPPVPPEENVGLREKMLSLRAVILPVILVILVLGSIFGGICTPTEAAAIGSTGAIICALINRKISWSIIKGACYRTITLTSMVMWIVIGGYCITSIYVAVGAPDLVANLLVSVPGGRWGPIIIMQLTFFILGGLLDPTAIIMITTPIFVPVVKSLGFDPVWFGVVFVVNMEMAYLTPPIGFNLFYMKGVVPPEITMGDIMRSAVPFIVLQAAGLIIVMVFPQIVLWLPNLLIG